MDDQPLNANGLPVDGVEQLGDAALPVLVEAVEARPVQRPQSLPAPIVAATGGFLAGAAAFVVMRLLRGRRRAPLVSLGRRRKRGRALEVAGTRSFLVDVHLLNKR